MINRLYHSVRYLIRLVRNDKLKEPYWRTRSHYQVKEIQEEQEKQSKILTETREELTGLVDTFDSMRQHYDRLTEAQKLGLDGFISEQIKITKLKKNLTILRGATILLVTAGIGAAYIGTKIYDRKHYGETLDTMKSRISAVTRQLEESEDRKSATDGKTLIRINNLETLLTQKTSNIVEDISTHIAKRGEYELETERKIKQLGDNYTRLEQERTEALKSLTETLKAQERKITEQDGKIKSYETQLEEQRKTEATLTEKLNQLEKPAMTNSPALN